MKRRDATLSRMLAFAAPYRSALALTIAFSVISVAATLYVPILTGDAIDHILGPGEVNFAGILPILARLLATALIGAAAQYLLGLCTNRLAYNLSLIHI